MRALLFVCAAACACRHPPPVEPAHAVDAEIAAMVESVSTERIAADVQKLVAFRTRNTCSTEILAARDFLGARLSTEGMTVAFDAFDAPCAPPVRRESVIGVLRGRDPTRLVLLGGHFDSRSTGRSDGAADAPGANDSGSQTALVLEVSRVLAGRSFDASIAFVAFAGEEQGLLGSSSIASHLAALFPGATLEAMLDCDIVGGDADANDAAALRRFRVYAPGAPRERSSAPDGTLDNTSPSRGLQRFVGTWGAAYVPAMEMIPKLREDRPGRGGDHEPFVALGVPAVRFIDTSETLAHQHSPEDTPTHLTPAYTARIARVVAATIATLARAPRAPTFSVTRAGGRLALDWTAKGADHVVVTTRFLDGRPETRVRATGSHLDLAAPRGPLFVTVSAVDAAGHESLGAWPEWRCDDAKCAPPVGIADARR